MCFRATLWSVRNLVESCLREAYLCNRPDCVPAQIFAFSKSGRRCPASDNAPLHNARVKPLMECQSSHRVQSKSRHQTMYTTQLGRYCYMLLHPHLKLFPCEWMMMRSGGSPKLLVLIILPRRGNRDGNVARSCPSSQ